MWNETDVTVRIFKKIKNSQNLQFLSPDRNKFTKSRVKIFTAHWGWILSRFRAYSESRVIVLNSELFPFKIFWEKVSQRILFSV
jgi:hypothetical protein